MLIICQFGKLQPPADRKKNRKFEKSKSFHYVSNAPRSRLQRVESRFTTFEGSAGYILAFQRREARIYADNPAKRNPDLARVIAQLIGDESTLPDCCLHFKLKYCNTEYCKFWKISLFFSSKSFLENTAVATFHQKNSPNFGNKQKNAFPFSHNKNKKAPEKITFFWSARIRRSERCWT